MPTQVAVEKTVLINLSADSEKQTFKDATVSSYAL